MTFRSTASILFNGSTQYGTAGNVLGFEYNQAFSLSAWVKTTDTNASLMSKWQSGAPAGYLFQLNSSSLLFGMVNVWSTDGFWVTAPCSPSDGSWHHMAVTYSGSGDSSGVQFYLDSVLLTKNAPSFDNLVSSVVNTVEFRLARDVSGADAPFAGAMDEVAVYNKVLSADEVKWIFNTGWGNDLNSVRAPSNLVSWWMMGEHTAGGVVPDWAAMGSYDLTLVGSPTVQSDGPVPASAYTANYVDTSYLQTAQFSPDAQRYDSSYVPTSVLFTAQYKPFDPYGGGGGPTVYYKMRARDSGVAPPGYVTWVSSPDPDFGGAGFSGGTPTPVGGMVPGSATVVARWEE